MNKIKIAAAAAGVLLLAGCGNKIANNNQNAGNGQNQEQERKQKGLVSSIGEAMKLGKNMRCAYKVQNQEGASEIVTYVKGNKYKTEMKIGGSEQVMIFDGEASYSWNKGETKGRKMSQKCMEELGQEAPEEAEEGEEFSFSAQDDNFDSAMDVKCEEISEADFSIPKNITFSDQCEEMKKAMEGIKNMNQNMPSGMPQGMPSNIPQLP